MPAASPQSAVGVPAPLSLTLLLTFLLSVGTGSVTLGLYFIAESLCGFSRTQQFLLGVVLGAAYIPAALAAGPMMRRLEARNSRLSPRASLMGLVLIGGAGAAVPPVLDTLGLGTCWAIWLVAAIYGLTTGVMWPLIEWYLTGGRKHAALRTATGRFNIVWTSAVVLSTWLLAPFLKNAPLDFLWLLAAVHVVSTIGVALLPKRPPAHLDSVEPHPPSYETLLAAARRLLPASYILMSVLGPYFPGALRAMGLDLVWQPVLVGTWLVARVGTVTVLERWHGWHGRESTLRLGAGLLFLGFVGCVLSPLTGQLPVLIGALATFGVGMGIIYNAALYYVMAVGSHGADAGGSHEALIGIGYMLGPALGLAISAAVDTGLLGPSRFEATLAAVTAGITVIGLVVFRSKQNAIK